MYLYSYIHKEVRVCACVCVLRKVPEEFLLEENSIRKHSEPNYSQFCQYKLFISLGQDKVKFFK